MTRRYFVELSGSIPSLYKDGVDYYGTNYGNVQTISCSGRVIDACIGFSDYSSPGTYKHFSIRIIRNSYSIRMGTIYRDYMETASANFSYKLPYVHDVNLSLVFNMLRNSGKLSRAIIAVILTLRHLLGDRLTGDSKVAMDNLVAHILQHHSSVIPRQPIVNRVPIRIGRGD